MKRVNQKAVVLLSGGIDSSTVAAIARDQGFVLYALTVDYGQRHRCELEAARRVAQHIGVISHKVIKIDLRSFGGSALTDDLEVPRFTDGDSAATEIPVTYVPARNTIMLSLALAWAEVLDASHIFTGVNAVDYSGYPDCRPEFIAAFQTLANLATKRGVEGQSFNIETPLIHLSKADIIRKGTELNVDYSLTHSCYDPSEDGLACGECDSCLIRRRGFLDAGVADVTRYAGR